MHVSLPDLSQLSVRQKDEHIEMLWPLQQQVQEIMVFGGLQFFGAGSLWLMRATWRSSCHKNDD